MATLVEALVGETARIVRAAGSLLGQVGPGECGCRACGKVAARAAFVSGRCPYCASVVASTGLVDGTFLSSLKGGLQ